MNGEPGELSQWLWSWWQHHKHCHGYYYYYYYYYSLALQANSITRRAKHTAFKHCTQMHLTECLRPGAVHTHAQTDGQPENIMPPVSSICIIIRPYGAWTRQSQYKGAIQVYIDNNAYIASHTVHGQYKLYRCNSTTTTTTTELSLYLCAEKKQVMAVINTSAPIRRRVVTVGPSGVRNCTRGSRGCLQVSS